ncbi:dihydroxyacetone kinase subunit DhaL [Azohydromonas australica]|uniref:dihydroxyacetone kinase subunit DhaL n=1 Tax=Azohydromonas australica TaxID=364039 RepID=UPI0004084F0B|nr:dihydroxyacetone kinase subunit DhaL [Azohydromonas australica]
MNRVINNPDLVVEDMLQGWLLAHAGEVAATANPRVVKRAAAPQRGKVGVVTGGGSGHEPAFLGYVGDGLLDAVAVGEIFSSPTAKSFLDAMRAADGGAGVACLYGNYAGDNMNVRMAREMAAAEGITVKTVVANDDVPSAAKGDEAKRRGVAGEILMWKVGAAKAALGGSLDEVIAVAQRAIANTRSIGIGLSACVIPAVGKANFHIEHGTMEVGIGHHGEPGIDVRQTVTAAEMAALMLDVVLPDLPFQDGDRVAVLLSGLGATPLMEQYILYGEVAKRLAARGIDVVFNKVGNLFTSLEMMGVTLTLMKVDDELLQCLQAPCSAVGLTVAGAAAAPVEYAAREAVAAGQGARPARQAASALPVAARAVVGASVPLDQAGGVVRALIATIHANRGYLSEIDGLIGDGDHGINMSKGFAGCATRLDAMGPDARRLPLALVQLSQALMDDIGGSMGPLYGHFFLGLAETLVPHERLDAALFGDALAAAVARVQALGNAQVGDKTLIDTLAPALAAYREALAGGAAFGACLQAMSDAAEAGKESTRALQARIGRSARLGARSIGVLDAGATSCCLLLQAMGRSLQEQLAN